MKYIELCGDNRDDTDKSISTIKIQHPISPNSIDTSSYHLKDKHFIRIPGIKSYKNGVFAALYTGFILNMNVKLSPDDIYLLIKNRIMRFIESDNNSVRIFNINTLFKKHIMLKHHKIKETGGNEKLWEDTFNWLENQIKSNIGIEYFNIVNEEFNNTSTINRLISSVSSVDKNLEMYDYVSEDVICQEKNNVNIFGIKGIYLDGELQDWVRIRDKITEIQNKNKLDQLTIYINKVYTIIDYIINSFDKDDQKFWQRIFNLEKNGDFTGWIFELICNKDRINNIDMIGSGVYSVDFTLDSYGRHYPMKLYTGCTGVIFNKDSEIIEPGKFWTIEKN